MRFFQSPPEPVGEVTFFIETDGRRVDVLPPPPLSQRCLGSFIWLVGSLVVLLSTHSDYCSLVCLVLVHLKDFIINCFSGLCSNVFSSGLSPESLRPLISNTAYDEQGKMHTEKALAQLRAFMQVQGNNVVYDRLRDDSELRMRRFSDGCSHINRPGYLDDDEPKWRLGSTLGCTIL